MSRCICPVVNWNSFATAIARRFASALVYFVHSSASVSVRRIRSAAWMLWRNRCCA